MDLVVWEAVEVDCVGRLKKIGQFYGQTGTEGSWTGVALSLN